MNVLITGGTGYIGSHTALTLCQQGHQVVLFDNLRQSNPQVASRLETLCDQPVPLVMGDVRDTRVLSCSLLEHEINAVVHCAGLRGTHASLMRPLDTYAHNLQGTLSVMQAMAMCDDPILVFSSSAAVYGKPRHALQDESHPTEPTTPLGRSLLQAENVIRDAVKGSLLPTRVAIMRSFHPAGAHESGLIGDCSGLHATAGGLMTRLARVAAGDDAWLPLLSVSPDTPDGTVERDHTHVMDIAAGFAAALDFLRLHEGLHTFNLGRGQSVSDLQAVKAFEAASGRQIPCAPTADTSDTVTRTVADTRLAKVRLGWEARRGLAEICESSWNHALTQKLINAPEARGVNG